MSSLNIAKNNSSIIKSGNNSNVLFIKNIIINSDNIDISNDNDFTNCGELAPFQELICANGAKRQTNVSGCVPCQLEGGLMPNQFNIKCNNNQIGYVDNLGFLNCNALGGGGQDGGSDIRTFSFYALSNENPYTPSFLRIKNFGYEARIWTYNGSSYSPSQPIDIGENVFHTLDFGKTNNNLNQYLNINIYITVFTEKKIIFETNTGFPLEEFYDSIIIKDDPRLEDDPKSQQFLFRVADYDGYVAGNRKVLGLSSGTYRFFFEERYNFLYYPIS